MKSFQERMYSQGFIFSDYEKAKPLADEIDRLSHLIVDRFEDYSLTQFANIIRSLHRLKANIRPYLIRNPLGPPNRKYTS